MLYEVGFGGQPIENWKRLPAAFNDANAETETVLIPLDDHYLGKLPMLRLRCLAPIATINLDRV